VTAPGRPADLPEAQALSVQAKALITAWLDKDYRTIAWIMHAIGEGYGGDGTPAADAAQQVAEVMSLAAAALLTDAFGGHRRQAAALAAARLELDATRQARVLAGLDADAA
jgi:hypothetical protein